MATAAGFLLALVCIAIVALAFGVAIACWDEQIPARGPSILRCTAVTIGAALLLLAALPTIAQVLP